MLENANETISHQNALSIIEAFSPHSTSDVSPEINTLKFALLWKFVTAIKFNGIPSDEGKINHCELFTEAMKPFVIAKMHINYIQNTPLTADILTYV